MSDFIVPGGYKNDTFCANWGSIEVAQLSVSDPTKLSDALLDVAKYGWHLFFPLSPTTALIERREP